jgi:hypothetical protein
MAEEKKTPPDMHEAEALCICKQCPTYFDCGEPLAFCVYESGRSTCITVDRGCICPGCPLYRTAGFTYDFYCTIGSEKAQKN